MQRVLPKLSYSYTPVSHHFTSTQHLIPMKNPGLSSPYARVGLFFCLFSTIIGGYLVGRQQDAALTKVAPAPVSAYDNPVDEFFDAIRSQEEKDALDYLNSLSAEPCFEVKIDPALLADAEVNRSDLFNGGEITSTRELLVSGLKTKLAASFSDEVWKRDPKCFDGSFVVSFGVNEDGSLSENMLVHHIKGGSNMAGVAVLDVLLKMNREGHRWHDGTQGAGEVRVPVSFKLV